MFSLALSTFMECQQGEGEWEALKSSDQTGEQQAAVMQRRTQAEAEHPVCRGSVGRSSVRLPACGPPQTPQFNADQ